jgi:hypothetical protein
LVTTLVSDVTTAYFQLRELNLELEISKRRLESRRASFRPVQARAQVALTASAGLGTTGADWTFFGPKGWSPQGHYLPCPSSMPSLSFPPLANVRCHSFSNSGAGENV